MILVLIGTAVAPIVSAQTQSGVLVDQVLMQNATVTNPRLIRFFAEDFMIPEEKIDKMVIYDLTGDGFGEGDLARTFPGGKFYLITPTENAQRIMNGWSFGGNVKFTADSDDPPELFENAPDSVRAMGGIFAALLRGLRRNLQRPADQIASGTTQRRDLGGTVGLRSAVDDLSAAAGQQSPRAGAGDEADLPGKVHRRFGVYWRSPAEGWILVKIL
ncbi:MAG: hypothetical protein Q9P14_08110 [candidate division KSB1 bacterium]|nr:hypothetical protein [candidate division KSB1 bacterium]